MKYPMLDNCIFYEQSNDNKNDYLTNYEMGWRISAKKDFCNFASKLDGHTDPYTLGLKREVVDIYLDELERNQLLRKKRLVRSGVTFLYAFTFKNKHSFNQRYKFFIYNLFLVTLFLPVFILGIYQFVSNYNEMLFNDFSPEYSIYVGQIFGIVIGMFLHEFGHYSSTLAFGGEVLETGIGTSLISPFAYVMNDVSNIKNRLFRMQVNAAGVESNFMLCGIFLIAASFLPLFSLLFAGVALSNGMLALLNMLPISIGSLELDGAHVLMDATNKDIIKQCMRNVFCKKDRQILLKQKFCGIKFAGSLVITGCQAIIPLYYVILVLNVVAIILDCF